MRRSLVMMMWVPGKILATRLGTKAWQQGQAINEYALGRIVAAHKGGLVFISEHESSYCVFVHCAFRGSFQTELLHFPLRHIRYAMPGFRPARRPASFQVPRRSPAKARTVPVVLAPATPRARGAAIPRASAIRRDPASAAALQAADYPEGFPAAVLTAVPA
jgi:hypothetical protein